MSLFFSKLHNVEFYNVDKFNLDWIIFRLNTNFECRSTPCTVQTFNRQFRGKLPSALWKKSLNLSGDNENDCRVKKRKIFHAVRRYCIQWAAEHATCCCCFAIKTIVFSSDWGHQLKTLFSYSLNSRFPSSIMLRLCVMIILSTHSYDMFTRMCF